MAKKKEAVEEVQVDFALGDKVLFHEYGETEEKEGVITDCPEEGKLTVRFEGGSALKINRCYLKKA